MGYLRWTLLGTACLDRPLITGLATAPRVTPGALATQPFKAILSAIAAEHRAKPIQRTAGNSQCHGLGLAVHPMNIVFCWDYTDTNPLCYPSLRP